MVRTVVQRPWSRRGGEAPDRPWRHIDRATAGSAWSSISGFGWNPFRFIPPRGEAEGTDQMGGRARGQNYSRPEYHRARPTSRGRTVRSDRESIGSSDAAGGSRSSLSDGPKITPSRPVSVVCVRDHRVVLIRIP
ncbi:MAG: hypothetical protein CMJ23_05840 [Phycisphaerae bacterium]|nr:hypothetical protein [Phycisphaerae bacterium]